MKRTKSYSKSSEKPGVTLIELMLTVVVVGVVAATVPSATFQYVETRNDMAATQTILNAITHARTNGLMGRVAESQIEFRTGKAGSLFKWEHTDGNLGTPIRVSLPEGFEVANLQGTYLVGGTLNAANSLTVKFELDGSIKINDTEATNASVLLKHDKREVANITISGFSLPQTTLLMDDERDNSTTAVPGCNRGGC